MKISACSICKNESKKIEFWFNNLKDCDDYYALDTGSSDDTMQKLKSLGVVVDQKIIEPFDFSKARNYSLELVEDADWIITLDFDEEIDKDWRSKVEEIVKNNPETTSISVVQGNETIRYGIPDLDHKIKIFKADSYYWNSAVHEHLLPKDKNLIYKSDIKVTHHSILTDDKENFYYSIAKKTIESGESNDWLVWFCLQHAVRTQNKSEIIKFSKEYLSLTESPFTDFKLYCLDLLSENLSYQEAVLYILKAFIQLPNEENFNKLINFSLVRDKPELMIFLSTLISREESKVYREEALKRLNF